MTGSLLYFGARRSWREMLAPLALFAAADCYLTTVPCTTLPVRLSFILPTIAWYAMAIALGHILLHARTTFARVGAGVLLGPTSFFLVSNFSVWASWTACIRARAMDFWPVMWPGCPFIEMTWCQPQWSAAWPSACLRW